MFERLADKSGLWQCLQKRWQPGAEVQMKRLRPGVDGVRNRQKGEPWGIGRTVLCILSEERSGRADLWMGKRVHARELDFVVREERAGRAVEGC